MVDWFAGPGVLKNLLAKPDIGDGGFLSGEPCGPPCLLGITPNLTTEAEAVRLLKAKGLYNNCYIYNHEAETGLRGAACVPVSLAYFRGSDVVGSIGFQPSQPITVEMVIAKYGDPDAVSVSSTWFNWENQPETSMALFYSRLGASLALGEQQGNTFFVGPSTRISGVSYSDNMFPSIREYEKISKSRSAWHGFGQYQEP